MGGGASLDDETVGNAGEGVGAGGKVERGCQGEGRVLAKGIDGADPGSRAPKAAPFLTTFLVCRVDSRSRGASPKAASAQLSLPQIFFTTTLLTTLWPAIEPLTPPFPAPRRFTVALVLPPATFPPP